MGWTELGCYVDSVGARVLDGPNYVDFDALTHASCATFCATEGFAYAGLEYMRVRPPSLRSAPARPS